MSELGVWDDEAGLRARHRFAELVQPMCGLMEGVARLQPRLGDPLFEVRSTSLGNLTMTFPHVQAYDGRDVRGEALGGAGADAGPELAWVRAVVEGAERYASSVYADEELVIASAAELGDAALDLSRLPRCSARELADPRCPVAPADPGAPIRWVRGFSLTAGRERLVPLIMTHLYVAPLDGERFWLPISTGVAAHTDPVRALVSAICEVIERDAIALTWLLRLPLPRIAATGAESAELGEALRRVRGAYVEHHLHDATTDLGVPTVYTLQVCPGSRELEAYVNCATSFDAAAACAKTIREAIAGRIASLVEREVPAETRDFTSLHHGALYYARGGHLEDFAFLMGARVPRGVAEMQSPLAAAEPAAQLRALVDRLRALDLEAVAVDLTTDELRRVGLCAVRVVIPDLLPMSPVHRARFLGTPRLYDYPRRAGFGARAEGDINPAPQPFA